RNVLRKDKFENRFDELEKYLGNFSSEDSFVMESTGFYEPLYDYIESKGFKVKLANPLKIKLIAESRMKNDDVDSEILAKLLKNNWIPESYVPNKEIRDLRRIVRTRIEIKKSTTSYKNRIKFETMRMHTDYDGDAFTLEGKAFLRNLKSPRIDSYLNVLNGLTEEVKKIDRGLKRYEDIQDVKLLQTIPGIGLFSSLLIYSEIGDINRFSDSSKLLSYAVMIPSVRQSSDVVHYGHITHQGSKYLRWILSECLYVHMRFDPSSSVSKFYRRISKGKKKKGKALVASANKPLKIIYWVLREKRPYNLSSME
ncbi:MAG: IS110 family transposase, partial [Thermoplasmatales archaeon]|nr:IS110 family transposase [Thermoplasmatales archaeon]